MSLRTTLRRLARRNPAAPSLADRAASVKAGLTRLKARKPPQEPDAGRRAVMGGALAAAVPLPALAAPLPCAASAEPAPSSERADYRARLLTLYAEDRGTRPVTGNAVGTPTREVYAAEHVQEDCWTLGQEILALSTPATLDGFGLLGLAAALQCEACLEPHVEADPHKVAGVVAVRALLAITGTPLPPGFSGFGDEPGFEEREGALHAGTGTVPAWALAEFDAEGADDETDAAADV